MWLVSYITNRSLSAPSAAKGELTADDAGGMAVASSGEHKELEFCVPYGFSSVPPQRERAVVLPLDDGEVGMGVLRADGSLEEGEVKLFSAGGASLVLKNDGSVQINGTRVLVNGREVGND